MDTNMMVAGGATALMLPEATRELAKKASTALAKCEHATKIWTHSRSGMMLRNMTIGGEYAPMRRMRQVAAEIQKKRMAMVEAKYNVLKKKKEAQIKRHEAKTEKDQLKREYLELEAAEIEESVTMVVGPYMGAMREVIELAQLHDALEEQIRKEYGKFDEEVFEKEEGEYWVRRAFAQSLRDIRQSGVITSGQQELLEQIGLDPSVVKKLLMAYLSGSEGRTDVNSDGLETFLFECSKKYAVAAGARVKRLGFPEELETSHLMLEEPKE